LHTPLNQVVPSDTAMSDSTTQFIFTEENFRNPKLATGLNIVDVPLVLATDQSLKGYGAIVHDPNDFTVEKGTFEIVPWPTQGWRTLDPGTGDEGGTTEGNFELEWRGDYYYGKNLAVLTTNNTYLGGLAVPPEEANSKEPTGTKDEILLWMSDYHPDGAQMFWTDQNIPFVVCLGRASFGDDITPQDMRSFYVPAGKGVYFHPGTWHNEAYILRKHSPATFFTRQGKVHARVSVNWAQEFKSLCRVKLTLDGDSTEEKNNAAN